MKITKPKTITVDKVKKTLYTTSHEYIRRRDGVDGEIKGSCFDCGKYAEGKDFQAGHFFPDGNSGFLLSYHPKNMHGQHSGCNSWFNSELAKIGYTKNFIDKYGEEYFVYLKSLKQKAQNLKPYKDFYETLLNLYKEALTHLKLKNDICNKNGKYNHLKIEKQIEDFIYTYKNNLD